MPGPQPPPIGLTERQEKTLRWIASRERSEQRLVRRSRIILEIAASGRNNTQVARVLGVHVEQVRTWRRRWLEASPRLMAAEEGVDEGEPLNEREFTEVVEAVLSDRPRPGGPAKFTAEEEAGVRAIACERLDGQDETSRPVSHWTPRELRDEAIERGTVDDVSVRTVGRWLKRGLCSPIASNTG